MKTALTLSGVFAILALQAYVISQINQESETRELATNILQDRIIALESHFIGHTVILAKDGKGISVVPCKLNIDKECYRDDTGISLSNVTIHGWIVGIDLTDNSTKRVPQKPKLGELHVTDGQFDGIKDINYTGPNDWRFRLNVFWTGIKQSFRELFHSPIGSSNE